MQSQLSVAIGLWGISLLLYTQKVSAIGCFVCSSINGSEPDCEDPFSNTGKFYVSDCTAARKGRSGTFPATGCVKLKAKKESGFSVMVRTCVVDNGDINSETEIGRESHCWLVAKVKFNEEIMEGCSLACNTNGCNSDESIHTTSVGAQLLCILLFSVTKLLGISV